MRSSEVFEYLRFHEQVKAQHHTYRVNLKAPGLSRIQIFDILYRLTDLNGRFVLVQFVPRAISQILLNQCRDV